MNLNKPKFWNKKNSILSILLSPISVFLRIFVTFKNKITKTRIFNIPVICVGNIYIGGTGKTPLSITIANELKKNNKNPIIIKKYYKNHKDEHELINEKVSALILDSKRSRALEEAEKRKFNVAILDDGFQDYSIKKKIEILCFNSKQLIGNGHVFPSGPLRENINSVKRCQIVVINGSKNEEFEKKILSISNNIKIFYSKYVPSNIDVFKNKKLFAFAGIGNPKNFFDLLIENGLNLEKHLSFPDHYNFSKSELEKMISISSKSNLELITTEKDYHRIKDYKLKNIKCFKTELKILEKEKFMSQILSLL